LLRAQAAYIKVQLSGRLETMRRFQENAPTNVRAGTLS
jgi:hypothetical protein